MELIKKIKKAESQAQEIIEQAKADTVRRRQDLNDNQLKVLEKAEQQRKKAIKAAVDAAQAEGLAEVNQLNEEAEKSRKELHHKADSKMGGAVTKVMDYLRD